METRWVGVHPFRMRSAAVLAMWFCLFIVAGARGEGLKPAAEKVPPAACPDEATVRIAGTWYAQERWPDSHLVACTPYYALDGSVNAWALQFAMSGCTWTSEAELLRAADEAEAARDLMQAAAATSETAKALGEDRDTQRQKLREAVNAAALPDRIGTIILAASCDLYPLLEAFAGVAPHVQFRDKVRKLAGLSDGVAAPIARTCYLGPCAYLHESAGDKRKSDGSPLRLVNAYSDEIHDMSVWRKTEGAGRLRAVPEKHGIRTPREVWADFEEGGARSRQGGVKPPTKTPTVHIQGVPFYHQDDYGPNCCGPCASAQAAGFWEDKGYGVLVDNGTANTGHVGEMITDLMRAQSYSPTDGTVGGPDGGNLGPGLNTFLQNGERYGNGARLYCGHEDAPRWDSDVKAELEAGRPFVYFNHEMKQYPNWAHFTTAVGYYDDADNSLLHVHDNYPPDVLHELNYDNIDGDNETMFRIREYSDASPYECLWSEDFESGWTDGWYAERDTETYENWYRTNYKAQNTFWVTGSHPSAWSAYCVQSGQSAPGPYPANVHTRIVYGPFSTIDRTWGEARGYIWRAFGNLFVLEQDDYFLVGASTDGVNFQGTKYSSVEESWQEASLDLTDVPGLGNLMGRERVWVCFAFVSDDDGWTGEGVYLDNFAIKLSESSTRVAMAENVRASDGAPDDGIQIQWDPVPGATHYRVWRSENPDGDYRVRWTWRTGTSYKDVLMEAGKPYYYKVQASASPHGSRAGFVSAYDTGWRGLGTPDNVEASRGTLVSKVAITWDSVPDANYYRVYRSDTRTSTKEPVTNWIYGATSAEDTTARSGDVFYYYVQAAHDSAGSRVGGMSDAVQGYAEFARVSTVSATDGTRTDGVMVGWSGAEGMSHYQVARSVTETGSRTTVSPWQTQLSYVDTSALPGYQYYYWVNCAANENGFDSAGYSDLSSTSSGFRAWETPAGLTASEGEFTHGVRVMWDPVFEEAFDTAYRVWRADSEDGAKMLVSGWIRNLTNFMDEGATPGQNHVYWVQASGPDGVAVQPSSFSESATGWRKLTPPGNVDASDSLYSDHIHVTWDAVEGASYYRLYRSGDRDGLYMPVTPWGAGRSYDDRTDFTPGSAVFYRVTAAKQLDGYRQSAFSDADAGSVGIAPPNPVAASQGVHPDRVEVTWPAIADAGFYEVSRSLTADGERSVVRAWDAARSYTDTDVVIDQTYFYRVRSSAEGAATTPSDYSAPAEGWVVPSPPTGVTASDNLYEDRVEVSWTALEGTTYYYQVYRGDKTVTDPQNATAQLKAWQTEASWSDTTAEPGLTYRYWLRASVNPRNSDSATDFGEADTGMRRLPAPSGLEAADGTSTSGIAVRWDPVDGAGYYRLSRGLSALPGIRKNVVMDWSQATSFHDDGATSGTVYYYVVECAGGATGANASAPGAPDAGWRQLPAPSPVEASPGTYRGRVAVNWEAGDSGADHFQVSRAADADGVFEPVSPWTAELAFDDTATTPGRIMYYSVRGALTDDGLGATAPGESVEGWSALTSATGVVATDGDFHDRVAITWNPVPHAAWYQVYRKERDLLRRPLPVSDWISRTAFSDTTAEAGARYEYSVRASAYEDGSAPGFYSLPNAGWLGAAPPKAPTGPDPADGATSVVLSTTLDWDDAEGAAQYDVFLWPSAEDQPASPTFAGLSDSETEALHTLDYGTTYSWQVTAAGNGGATPSPVWQFTTHLGYSIEVRAENGTVGQWPDLPRFGQPTLVILQPEPAGGYAFLGWDGDVPEEQRLQNPLQLMVDRDMVVRARFATTETAAETWVHY